MKNEGLHWPQSFGGYDAMVQDFLEYLWETGASKGTAGDALSALQHFCPALRHHLNGSWRLYSAWTRAEIPLRAPPLTADYTLVLAGKALRLEQPRIAVALMVGFQCLLRTGELLGLSKRDCLFQNNGVVLNLGLTKSGQRRVECETVVLDDHRLTACLHRLLRPLHPDARLVNVSGPAFRTIFRQLVADAQLPLPFKPYSLRRGGATHHYTSARNLGAVTVRGRWSSQSTARIYISEATAELGKHEFVLNQRHHELKRELLAWLPPAAGR
jgi:integrase